MNLEEFKDLWYYLSVQAGTNQRYHQARSSYWDLRDRVTKIAVGVLAVIGVCLSVVTVNYTGWRWQAISISINACAAVAAIALNVLPLGEWASDHRALFQRWSDIREDVDALELELRGKVTNSHIDRLNELQRKVHRICASEPGMRETQFRECYEAECRSRHSQQATIDDGCELPASMAG